MRGLFNYIVSPIGDRYNNKVQVEEGKDLIINTEISNHEYVNRVAEVVQVPIGIATPIRRGQEVLVHHQVFRRWYDVKGRERNSRAWANEDKYLVEQDQVFLYRNAGEEWNPMPGYCFVQPIENDDRFSLDAEKPLVGVVRYSGIPLMVGKLVGFSPNDEFEFIVDGVRLYRVMDKYINIEYEYQGDEKAYNPSWA